MRITDTHLYFYGTRDIYSNFHPAKFEAEIFSHLFETGRELLSFNCSEQMFMALKAVHFEDIESFNKIMAAHYPATQKALGKKVKGFIESEWDEVKFDYMCVAVLNKFSKIPELRDKLLATELLILVEATSNDKIWGIGLDEWDDRILDSENWLGQNLLGLALMYARSVMTGQSRLYDIAKIFRDKETKS